MAVAEVEQGHLLLRYKLEPRGITLWRRLAFVALITALFTYTLMFGFSRYPQAGSAVFPVRTSSKVRAILG